MKKIQKQKVNKKPKTTKSQFGVILEDINSKINLIVEGHQLLDGRLEKNEGKFDRFEEKFDGFEIDTKNNFKTALEYLMRIDEEIISIKSEISELKTLLSKKVDLERLVNLETRVQKLELLLAQKK